MTFYFSETPKPLTFRNGGTGLAVNVVVETDVGMFAYTGFRIVKGKVMPPAAKVGGGKGGTAKWIDTVLLDPSVAVRMVQAMRERGLPVAEEDEVAAEWCVLKQEKIERMLS